MRAIEITRFGPPEVLRETQRPDPVPAPGELLIAVQASGVNRPDVLQRKGLYPMPPGVSDLPGLEVAGTVVGGAPRGPGGRRADARRRASARWSPAAAMPSCAWRRSGNACRCRRA